MNLDRPTATGPLSEAATLPDLLRQSAALHPGRPAIVDTGTVVTYAGLLELATRYRASLTASGIAQGERVVILLPNGIDFVAAHFGVLATGAVSVPLDIAMEISVLAQVLAHCEPAVVVTDEARRAQLVAALGQQLPWLRFHVVARAGGEARLEMPDPAEPGARASHARPGADDGCDVLMFTSGTSGPPRGAKLRHRHVLAMVKSVRDFVGYTCEDVELIVLPLSHSFGLGQLYVCLARGACACIGADLIFPAKLAAEARHRHATGFSCTPATLALLLKLRPQLFQANGDRLRYCVVNSAAVAPSVVRKILELNPHFRVFHYYGLTEASRTTFVCFNDSPAKIMSVGRPMPHARVKIVGERSVELAPGEVGEIAIAGEAVFNGYWRNPEASAQASRDGWFYSGDLGYLDPDGFLFLVGRAGDIINVDGCKFHPGEVETFLLEFGGVQEAGVLALPDDQELSGAKVVALIVPAAEGSPAPDILRTACARGLRTFKVPRAFFRVDKIPRFSSGKIDRKHLRILAEGLRQN